MVTITFPDREAEEQGLDYLLGEFPYREVAAGQYVVPDAAAEALASRQVRFAVTGKPAPTVHRHPDIMSGMPVFVGTRVPARSLIDHLASGVPLDEFLADFPSVSREQAVAYLEAAQEAMDRHAGAA
ncbi:MAG: DUF433 domain-containing protein [Gemmataceae bacterium]|nr:DUF433 domain-containing protein [Gemmataceae bacterium]